MSRIKSNDGWATESAEQRKFDEQLRAVGVPPAVLPDKDPKPAHWLDASAAGRSWLGTCTVALCNRVFHTMSARRTLCDGHRLTRSQRWTRAKRAVMKAFGFKNHSGRFVPPGSATGKPGRPKGSKNVQPVSYDPLAPLDKLTHPGRKSQIPARGTGPSGAGPDE
jgi:hypothetical protein